MALTDAALTTLAVVKDELGISDTSSDDYLERAIERASASIATLTARTLHYSAAAVDDVPGYGSLILSVPRYPLVSITSIAEVGDVSNTTLDATAYAIESAAAGLIRAINGNAWGNTGSATGTIPRAIYGSEQRRYRVTYAGGYITPHQVDNDGSLTRTLPYDLEDLCVQAVVAAYRAKGVDPNLRSERLLSWSASYGTTANNTPRGMAGVLTDDNATILAYRRVLQ